MMDRDGCLGVHLKLARAPGPTSQVLISQVRTSLPIAMSLDEMRVGLPRLVNIQRRACSRSPLRNRSILRTILLGPRTTTTSARLPSKLMFPVHTETSGSQGLPHLPAIAAATLVGVDTSPTTIPLNSTASAVE